MATVLDAKATITDFFVKELKKEADGLRFMEVSKTKDGWDGRVEVTETSTYLKKMGYPPVYDKNIYRANLGKDLNIVGYSQVTKEEEEEKE
ncbi:hypothetical protein L6386_00990 [bacterium]|nr:hypothetical protein [bacterium]